MLDTGASCSIIVYRTFWEICQLQHPITIQKSTKVTKTYSGQTNSMIGYATITFSYDPDGQLIFPLTGWITEMRTCVKNKFLEFFLIYMELNWRSLPSQFASTALFKTNPILIYYKFWQLEPLIRCVLTLKVPVVGSTLPETLIHISHWAQLFNRIKMPWLLAYLS